MNSGTGSRTVIYCGAMNSARRFAFLSMLATVAGGFLSLAIVWSL